MGKIVDLTGRVFGRLIVLSLAQGGRKPKWMCKCECGNRKIILGNSLKSGSTKSCGCLNKESSIKGLSVIDLNGRKFGRLTVLRREGSDKNRRAMWRCRCECGIEKVFHSQYLILGDSKSCGCFKIDMAKTRKREKSPSWKGGRRKNKDGYILIYNPDHLNANKIGYVTEHVKIMSEYMSRPLFKGETVHHKNGIRDDNKIENLELWISSHPYGQRVSDILVFCREFISKYGDLKSQNTPSNINTQIGC